MTVRVRRTETEQSELLRKAASCYRAAGADEDACRCLERFEEFSMAAALHEQGQRYSEAARCFERAGAFAAAARCHLAADQPLDAANCLMSAGSTLEAAWVLAHHAHAFARARSVLSRLDTRDTTQQLAAALVLSRCDVRRDPARAAAAIRRVIVELVPAERVGMVEQRSVEWALDIAELLDRPDLIAELRSAMHLAHIPFALQDWEAWAMRRLKSSQGIPLPKEEA